MMPSLPPCFQRDSLFRGGPYAGHKMPRLATKSTLVFTARGQTGHYTSDGSWVPLVVKRRTDQ
jgi:hypothetical protein